MTEANRAESRSVAAIVLAAGYSRRIGRPKALLPLGNATCLDRVLDACAGAGLAPVHVVVGHRGGEIAAAAHRRGAAIVWNDRYPEGQLASLQAGLRSLPSAARAAVLIPVDLALVGPSTIRSLLFAYHEEGEGRAVFVPTFERAVGRPYLVDISMVPELLSLPPGATGRSVLLGDPGRVREVPVDDDGILFDLGTPDDYLLFLEKIRARRES